MTSRTGSLLALLVGFGALVGGTVAGWNEGLLDALVTPPAIVRAALIAVAVVVGVELLGGAARRIGDAGGRGRDQPDRDLPGMIRAVRLAFLAVAAFAAAAGWALAHPLPIVIALIIAAIDVVETSFLLLVVTFRGDRT